MLRPLLDAVGAARHDVVFHYSVAARPVPGPWPAVLLANPSLRAALLMRLCAGTGGVGHYLWRNILLSLHGCDVAYGARFNGPIDLPHPIGIVIGAGAQIGSRVRIFQNVTIGRNRGDGYPAVHQDSVLFAGCVVVGPISVGPGATVGANAIVTRDVCGEAVVRSA